MDDKKKAIENLLLNIDELNELDKWTNDVNFFEISGMRNQEIRHSQVLAWLLDPNENHFLDDEFIRRFLQKVISRNISVTKGLDIFDVSLINYSSFIVRREFKHIDIVIYSEELKTVIAIENKVHAKERKNQLPDYYKVVKKEFKDYDKFLFIFLTKEGDIPSDPDNWCMADYKMVIEALEETVNSNININSKVKMIISDYVSMIRRNFGMDNELKKTVQRIYLRHKKAFDLVYEVASTGHMQFSDYIKDWLEKNKTKYNINYDENYSTASLIRFTTPFIDEVFPFDKTKEDGWKYGYSFMYEFDIRKDGITFIGVLANMNRPNSEVFRSFIKRRRKASQWLRVLPAKRILNEDQVAEGLTEENVKTLNKSLETAIEKHLVTFEKDMKKHIDNQI